VEEAMTTRDELTRPLAEEKLQFTGKDGKPSGMVLLGDRMKRFKKVILKEEKELTALWKEWADVQELIAGVGVELLGSQAMDLLAQQSGESTIGTDSAESRNIAQDIEGEKENLKQEIETMSNGLIEKMYMSEKVRGLTVPAAKRGGLTWYLRCRRWMLRPRSRDRIFCLH